MPQPKLSSASPGFMYWMMSAAKAPAEISRLADWVSTLRALAAVRYPRAVESREEDSEASSRPGGLGSKSSPEAPDMSRVRQVVLWAAVNIPLGRLSPRLLGFALGS